ncbi:MAG: ACP S-malonyltransferase [Acidobacteria bacterium]|nr:ACP S-malonyltransferase [Acidobacteriota bacterium]
MSKTAFVFPGQASQYSGMGLETAREFPVAAAVFAEADEVLGFPLSELCFQGAEEQLTLTEHTQPAILTVSVAVLRVLEQAGRRPDYVAGHSLGEYSALVAAGAISFADAVAVVRLRGRYMQEAVPVGVGAMAAVLGADLVAVEEICDVARGEQVLQPANINCPGQVVIAGHREAVERAIERAKEKGFRRTVLLPVSAPFHCELMVPAREKLADRLVDIAFHDLWQPLVNNVDAAFISSGVAARDSLIRQVTAAVRWQQSMEKLLAEGVDTFVEIGPKTVLSGMIKKISRDVRIMAVEKPAEIRQAMAEWE